MTKKSKNILFIIIAILALWFFIRFVIGGPEDDWICDDGQWIKHGAPAAPMPEGECSLRDNFNPFK